MDSTASSALVVAIVAVVLGGIGLIGGVIGYVQGTSAVARATHARQRAVVAEEEALQARAAAEATARAAEELLDRSRAAAARLLPAARLERAAPATGPTVQPDRLPTTSGAMLLPETTGPTVLPAVEGGVAVVPEEQQSAERPAALSPEPVAEPSAEAAPLATTSGAMLLPETTGPAVPPGIVGAAAALPGDEQSAGRPDASRAASVAEPAEETEPLTTTSGAMLLPETTGPAVRPGGADAAAMSGEQRAVEGAEEPLAASSGTEPVQPDVLTEHAGSPTSLQEPASPELASPGSASPDPAEQPADRFEAPPVSGSAVGGASADDRASVAAGLEAAPQDASIDAADDAPAASDDQGAPRDERGRVVAGEQAAPTMDWAEVLRTGAIPLPSISRGTYSAPRRRPKPTGVGPARFELRAIGRQRFEAVNVGGEPALDAHVEGGGDDPHLVRPLSARPSTVQPAAALAFSVLRVEGRRATVVVRWSRGGEPVAQDLPLE